MRFKQMSKRATDLTFYPSPGPHARFLVRSALIQNHQIWYEACGIALEKLTPGGFYYRCNNYVVKRKTFRKK